MENISGNVFESYITANLIYALHESGIMTVLDDKKFTNIDGIISSLDIDENRLFPVLKQLESVGVIEVLKNTNEVKLTNGGAEIKENIGFFVWCIGGYGELLRTTGSYLKKGTNINWEKTRDGLKVSEGAFICSKMYMDSYFLDIFNRPDINFIADIGCGKADMLFKILKKYENLNGVGIDINPASISYATKKIIEYDFQKRLSVVNNDIFSLPIVLKKVDTIVCSLILHDILNVIKPEQLSDWLKSMFPDVKYLIVIDTVLPNSLPLRYDGLFTPAFLLLHSFMNIKLRDKEFYDNLFKLNMFKTISYKKVEKIPNTHIYFIEIL